MLHASSETSALCIGMMQHLITLAKNPPAMLEDLADGHIWQKVEEHVPGRFTWLWLDVGLMKPSEWESILAPIVEQAVAATKGQKTFVHAYGCEKEVRPWVILLKTGILRRPPLFKLPLFPDLYPFNFTLESLHLDYQNITKDIINRLRSAAPAARGKQLSTAVLAAMSAAQEASQLFILTGVAEHLPPLKEKVGTYKGDQRRTLIGISIPPSLFGITFAVPEVANVLAVLSKYTSLKERTRFSLTLPNQGTLVDLTTLPDDGIPVASVATVDRLRREFFWLYKCVCYACDPEFAKMVTPSIHRLPHSPTFIRPFGLPKQTSTWELENYAGASARKVKGKHLLAVELKNNYTREARQLGIELRFALPPIRRAARYEQITNYNKTTPYGEVLSFLSLHLLHNGCPRPEGAPRLVAITSPFPIDLVLHQMCPSFLRSAPRSSTIISIEQIQMGMGLHFCTPEDGKLNWVTLVVEKLLEKNADFACQSVEFEDSSQPADPPVHCPTAADHEMVTHEQEIWNVLHQCVLDWSETGRVAGKTVYERILKALDDQFGGLSLDERTQTTVNVPDAGASRLAFQIAKRGYSCSASDTCDTSLAMVIASGFILHGTTTPSKFPIYPNLRSFASMARAAKLIAPSYVPDRCRATEAPYDVLVTPFSFDLAANVVAYPWRIWKALKPGGLWVNCSPTLWRWKKECQPGSIELTLADLKDLVRGVGFELLDQKEIKTSYPTNPRSVLGQCEYPAEFWVARRPSSSRSS
ncbi:hypothetical protein JCM1840_001405 [Sporobolomyces johnsonii]